MFRIEELSMKIKRFFSNIYKKFINIIFSKIYGKITYTKQKTQNIKINKPKFYDPSIIINSDFSNKILKYKNLNTLANTINKYKIKD